LLVSLIIALKRLFDTERTIEVEGLDINNHNKEKYSSSSTFTPSNFNNCQQTKLPTSVTYHQLPTRKQSCIDLNMNTIITNNNTTSRLPPRMKKTKSNQSLKSTSTTTSAGSNSKPTVDYHQQQKANSTTTTNSRLRQPSPAASNAKPLMHSDSNPSLHSAAMKRKSLTKIEKTTATNGSSGEDDEIKSCVTRSSSNGSIAALEKRNRRTNSIDKRRSKQLLSNDQTTASTGGDNFVLDMLKDELEREKCSARALLGQKEGISSKNTNDTKLIQLVISHCQRFGLLLQVD
jgi:hypothetical protein